MGGGGPGVCLKVADFKDKLLKNISSDKCLFISITSGPKKVQKLEFWKSLISWFLDKICYFQPLHCDSFCGQCPPSCRSKPSQVHLAFQSQIFALRSWPFRVMNKIWCTASMNEIIFFCIHIKVIYPKFSKHWLSTVAHTIDCVCSKILNHGLK